MKEVRHLVYPQPSPGGFGAISLCGQPRLCGRSPTPRPTILTPAPFASAYSSDCAYTFWCYISGRVNLLSLRHRLRPQLLLSLRLQNGDSRLLDREATRQAVFSGWLQRILANSTGVTPCKSIVVALRDSCESHVRGRMACWCPIASRTTTASCSGSIPGLELVKLH